MVTDEKRLETLEPNVQESHVNLIDIKEKTLMQMTIHKKLTTRDVNGQVPTVAARRKSKRGEDPISLNLCEKHTSEGSSEPPL